MPDPLLQLIAGITGTVPANATDASLLSEDLRLDSLGRVQLQSALEQKLGIELPDNVMERINTLGGLRSLLRSPNHVVASSETAPTQTQASLRRSQHRPPRCPRRTTTSIPTGPGGLRRSCSASSLSKRSCAH